MNCKEIIEKIEEKYNTGYACDWDNVGLLAGREDKEVKTIYLALDATDLVISHAISNNADMLITHHPMIFGSIKRVTDKELTGKKIISLVQNDISYYAAHTNYDVITMAELAAGKLGFKEMKTLEVMDPVDDRGIGKVGIIDESLTLREWAELVKEKFHLENVKVFGDLNKKIKIPAISPGSGNSMTQAALDAGADLLITGDIDHHTGIDSVDCGLSIIDAGHYGLEHIFIKDMQRFLSELPGECEILKEPLKSPFVIV